MALAMKVRGFQPPLAGRRTRYGKFLYRGPVRPAPPADRVVFGVLRRAGSIKAANDPQG